MKKDQIAFKTRARLLCQLGEQLIKSEDIALLELIKNSYDADATYCNVLMENVSDPKNGRIVIDDDGCGMSAERILHTWLEIGTNFKESLASDESTKRTPKFKRMRLGEKGIGRFGVHRLGHKIDVYSKSADSRQEAHLAIDWRSAEKAEMIEDVPVSLTEEVPQYFKGKKTGTHIVITNLKGTWTRKMARDVARAIATLNSPFEEQGEFVPTLKLTGQRGEGKWIDGIVTFDEIRAKSLGSFEIALKGNRIKSFEYHFTPWKVMDKLQPRTVKWDSKHVEARLITEDDEEIDLSEIGEVSFKGLVFDLDTKILKLGIQDVMGFKEYLQANGGVRVYRDNMRVLNYGEPDDDWLDLNFRRVNQPTRKVSSNVIIAAVGLSRESSGALQEKANREGFLKNAAFMKLRGAILYALSKVELERSADKDRIRAAYGKKAEVRNRHVTMNDLRADVETYVKNKVARKKMLQCIDRVEDQFEEFADSLIKSAGAGLNLSMVIHQMEKIIKNIKAMLRKRGHESDVAKQIDTLAQLIEGYSILIRDSDRKVRNLDEIVEQSVYNVGFRLSAHKIDLVDAYKKRGKCLALCTENHAINAMLNLFDNSIWWLGYSKTESPKVYVDIVESKLYKNSLAIVVADNGPGFSRDPEEMIKPFVTAKPNGMGIGLHLTNEIMLSLGGKLDFPSAKDVGVPKEFANGAIVALVFPKEA